ncbi:MAG TPA: hypothetical protein H9763_11690 [Candidatus Eisenbergiella merdigallinarum]|uniref:Uncharacterized protein n=1 Tax=Candidatus Eisenbergiella merdigallinarum TaxID=2838552 RepID=A0A9D2MUX5_9FIRM|nr:hypothetical protein [Candidatus Eisenbergiella merdigallinarum]
MKEERLNAGIERTAARMKANGIAHAPPVQRSFFCAVSARHSAGNEAVYARFERCDKKRINMDGILS